MSQNRHPFYRLSLGILLYVIFLLVSVTAYATFAQSSFFRQGLGVFVNFFGDSYHSLMFVLFNLVFALVLLIPLFFFGFIFERELSEKRYTETSAVILLGNLTVVLYFIVVVDNFMALEDSIIEAISSFLLGTLLCLIPTLLGAFIARKLGRGRPHVAVS